MVLWDPQLELTRFDQACVAVDLEPLRICFEQHFNIVVTKAPSQLDGLAQDVHKTGDADPTNEQDLTHGNRDFVQVDGKIGR